MKVIGLTGGIGSGKTTVAQMFQDLGIPIYIADDEAKRLMHSTKVKNKVVDLLGEQAYHNDELNRDYISSKVFNNKNLLEKLNQIVHPEVKSHFENWLKHQKSSYIIKEAAILFENGNYKNCFKNILVIADKKKRISRVLERDKTTSEKVTSIMENQWPDKEKIKLADFVIKNNATLEELKNKVYEVHNQLLKLITV